MKSAYYIEPDKVGRKAFYLLRQVLEDEDLTAICKVVIKDREALAAIDPFGDTMLMTTLHWPDEIRSTGELDLPEDGVDFKPAEIAMAKQLVSAMTGEFRPEEYKDEYREALEKIIEAKVEGRETVEVEEPETRGQADRPDGRARGVGQRRDGVPQGTGLGVRGEGGPGAARGEGREGQARGSPKHREGEERRGRGGRRVRIAPQAQVRVGRARRPGAVVRRVTCRKFAPRTGRSTAAAAEEDLKGCSSHPRLTPGQSERRYRRIARPSVASGEYLAETGFGTPDSADPLPLRALFGTLIACP